MWRAVAVLVVASLASCTSSTGEVGRHDGRTRWEEKSNEQFDYTISLPPGWNLAPETLTPNLGDPTEILSVGTYGLRPGGRCAQFPVNALEDLGARDAFATIQERGHRSSDTLVPRPPHLESLAVPSRATNHLEAVDCLADPDKELSMWWIPFQDEGRDFYLLAALGPDAPHATVDTLWEILDRIRFS